MRSTKEQPNNDHIGTPVEPDDAWNEQELHFIAQLRSADPLTRARALALLYAGQSDHPCTRPLRR